MEAQKRQKRFQLPPLSAELRERLNEVLSRLKLKSPAAAEAEVEPPEDESGQA